MRPHPATIGPYVVERTLGQGGMGVVYVCRHPGLPRPVAVKQVLARGADARTLQRFEREAALMARLEHPALVAVHELGHSPDGPYIVMELVEGHGLDRAAREGVLPPADAARITRDLALAVAALHAAGVIHRDIKPSNVLRRADGSPVLLDFGLARELAAERLTRTGEVLGTVAYMPPEQADGRNAELDERVDVYALGALLYELLAGRPPYEGGGIQVVAKVLGPEDPPPPSAAGRPVPPGLEAIVRTAMAKRREDRYPTARALAADLTRYLERQAPVALRMAPRGLRAPLAGALALLALGGGGLLWSTRGDPAEAVTEAEPPREEPPPPPLPPEPPAEAAPLWIVAPEQRLEYDLEFEEEGAGQSIRLRCRLALRRAATADQALAFACEVLTLSARFGVIGTEVAPEYDSTRDAAEHPLRFLGAAVGQPFECELDPRTGSVRRMRGFGAVRDLVHAKRRGLTLFGMDEQDIDRFVRRVFDDAFMAASMNALTNVRPPRTVPWAGAPSQESVHVVRDAPAAAVLPSLTSATAADDTHRFTGETTYADGCVERGELTQETTREGARVCVTTWRMVRVRP